MADKIDNLTFDLAVEQLQGGMVLSKKTVSYTRKTNLIQLLYKDGIYHYYYFNGYGQKVKNMCRTIKELEIHEHLSISGREAWYSHKQRISKKQLDGSIVDEESIKALVYEWLLNKYKDNAVIIPELSLDDRRADYIAFGDKEVCVVEIKSEVDTIDRLQDQINRYVQFANLTYIALHPNKLEAVQSMLLPNNVGIIQVTDKLKVIKKAKKQRIDFNVFGGFLSYKEYESMKSGFKRSSLFVKDDMVDIFDTLFTKKQRADYIYSLMKDRYKYESDKRLKHYQQDELQKAIGGAKHIGFDRLSVNDSPPLLKNFFNLHDNFLSDYMTKFEKKYETAYKGYKYKDLLLYDKRFLHTVSKKLDLDIMFYASKLTRLTFLIENKKHILSNRALLDQFVTKNIEMIVNYIKTNLSNEYVILEVESSYAKNILCTALFEESIGFTTVTFSYFKQNKNHTGALFHGFHVLVVTNYKNESFWLGKSFKEITLWRELDLYQ